MTAAVLVATPYFSEKAWSRSAEEVTRSPSPNFAVVLDRATVSLQAGAGFDAAYTVQGFGFPTSRMAFAFVEGADAAVLGIDRHGFFSERRTAVRLTWPAGASKPLRLSLGKGQVALDLRGFSSAARLTVEVEEGAVRVRGAEALRDGRATVHVGQGTIVEE
jgi:hypothetical protein